MESISTFRSVLSRNFSKLAERTTKPGGTARPAEVISPSEAPLPPAMGESDLESWVKDFIKFIDFFRRLIAKTI